ncbi:hypothetical protein L9F63_015108, partial [Diploptera punctata]
VDVFFLNPFGRYCSIHGSSRATSNLRTSQMNFIFFHCFYRIFHLFFISPRTVLICLSENMAVYVCFHIEFCIFGTLCEYEICCTPPTMTTKPNKKIGGSKRERRKVSLESFSHHSPFHPTPIPLTSHLG